MSEYLKVINGAYKLLNKICSILLPGQICRRNRPESQLRGLRFQTVERVVPRAPAPGPQPHAAQVRIRGRQVQGRILSEILHMMASFA